jgi:hypothetical protein
MMRHLLRVIRRRLGPVAGACVLLAGGIGAGVLAVAGPAQAAACSGAVNAGTSCFANGTLTFTAGFLTLTSPAVLTWAATDTGVNQQVVDGVHQTLVVDDATGSGAGWNVTVSVTTFTNGTVSLPTTGTFWINGSTSSQSAATTPIAACTGTATCTVSTDAAVTYPLNVITGTTTVPAPVKMYDAPAATGMGSITISPVGWWVSLLANAQAATYTSTVTLEVISAP